MSTGSDSTPEPLDAARRRPTLSDVAAMSGVSVSTASRALDENPRIPPATRRRVRDAATTLGFKRNISARALRTQSSMLVGVVVPDIAIAFYATVLKAAQNVLESSGYQVVVMNTERDAAREATALRTLEARQVDGLLVATTGGYVPDRTPVVFFDHVLDDIGVGRVSPDNAGGIATLVEHVAKLHGHQRIAYVGAPPGPTDRIRRLEHAPATERLEAFRTEMGRHRLPVPPEYLVLGDEEWTEASAQHAVEELMRDDEPPTAIVAASDTLALGAMRGLRRAGHRVGHDVALVSFDDPVSSDLLDPPMTALARHDRELGETSARLLLAALKPSKAGAGGRPQTIPARAAEIRVPLELIVRGSCGCVAGKDDGPDEEEPGP